LHPVAAALKPRLLRRGGRALNPYFRISQDNLFRNIVPDRNERSGTSFVGTADSDLLPRSGPGFCGAVVAP